MRLRYANYFRPAAALLLLLLAACGSGTTASEEPARGPVVLAASSLQEALEEVAAVWTASGHPAPVLSFAASSALARQVEQGAPADVFISADEEWMNHLQQAGAIEPASRQVMLTNRLVIVGPRDLVRHDLRLTPASLSDALGTGRLALADPEGVPAGRYARAALETHGLWPVVADRLAPAENVRAALAFVERGQAPLGIVYATDARAARLPVVAAFPAESHPPIRYPVADLAASSHPDGDPFRRFLLTPPAQDIFAKHGFGLAP